MERLDQRARGALHHLYVILDAGEKGYRVATANVSNRATKVLCRTYARQRADFKDEVEEIIGPQRGGFRSLIDFLAGIYRGRINIFAALTIGDQNREQWVLKEVLVGERAALKAYQRALRSGLPDTARR